MKRRKLGLALAGLIVVALAIGAAAVAGLQPADLSYTPNSEGQMTNIDVARAYAKNYYGAPTAVTGSGATATWNASLNLDSNYASEAESVAKQGQNWLAARANVPHRAIVLDVDDTTLTTWNYELYSNWDFNPATNASFVGLTGTTFTGNMFPATPGMLDLVTKAHDLGYAIFWITGRGDAQHQATIANLQDDVAAGFSDITSVTLSGKTVPEIDAGYQPATAIDIGHGHVTTGTTDFADGLFTKPPVGQYPAYLNKPEFCAAAIAANASCATIPYKSGTRAYIESQGYDIVADFGDQFSDLLGGFADKTFKMPNPNYYLP
jgi:predicted secreted acid phosphatase